MVKCFTYQILLKLHSAPSFSSFASDYYSLYVVDLNFLLICFENKWFLHNKWSLGKCLKETGKSKCQNLRVSMLGVGCCPK